jgi:Carboxypeptidase regulatory-like domain
VVRGVVRAAGVPVRGAEVLLVPARLRALTSDSGRFEFASPVSGAARIAVRLLGYLPISRSLTLGVDDTLTLQLELERMPQQLPGVQVETPAIDPSMEPFETRRREGFGRFVTRAQLAKEEHSTVSNVLRRAGGLRLMKRAQLCGGGFAAATGRGMTSLMPGDLACSLGGAFEVACYLSIWLDGAPIWRPGIPDPPDVDQFTVAGIEAIEVYNGPSQTPIQYLGTGSSCGAVLLWTRRSQN